MKMASSITDLRTTLREERAKFGVAPFPPILILLPSAAGRCGASATNIPDFQKSGRSNGALLWRQSHRHAVESAHASTRFLRREADGPLAPCLLWFPIGNGKGMGNDHDS